MRYYLLARLARRHDGSPSKIDELAFARASGLYACLREADAYYTVICRCGTAFYTDHLSGPGVSVLCDDGYLLAEPGRVSVVSAPAVNRSVLGKNEPVRCHDPRIDDAPTHERLARAGP